MAWYSNLAWILAQAAPAADAAPPEGANLAGMLSLIVALAVVIGSFVAGGLIARGLRMPDYGFKIGLVLFALFAGLAINYFGWPPKRGIDLSGGVVLVYEVDTGTSSANWMQSAVARINEQLNAEGGERLEARPQSETQIEIVLPDGVNVEKVEEKVAAMRDTADVVTHLESRREEDGKTVLLYRANPAEERRVNMGDMIAAVNRRINPGGVKELTIRQYGAEQLEVIIPEVEEREVEQIKKKISTSGLLEFRIVANPTDDKDVIKAAERTSGNDVYISGRRVGRWVKAGEDVREELFPGASFRTAPDGSREILVRIDPYNVDGRYLTRAGQTVDERGGLAVDFSFDSLGAERFRQLTSRNLPDSATGLERHLGIVLDNTMISAPTIRSTISSRGQITGNFAEDYVNLLVGVLNAGRLPASLRPEPISEQRISSQLGDDTIRAGANAMVISTAAILLFMLVYYRFAGLVADVAVTLNVIVTVALMILLKAAFTLPGLAGLVLTVGMAVDANVLIYERIREESERGASLRMAIRNGFSRATGTIVDANITTLITAVVLYVIGTDQIKGFAVTLILGLLVSMFTAIFVARVIFDIAERKRWLTKLTMMRIVGHTNFDFIRWRVPAMACSAVVIAIGLAAAMTRGKELLDIDFTGGSSVQLVLAEGKQKNIAEVRQAVAELPDVAVSSVGESGLEFKIDTSDNDVEHVQTALQDTFGDALKTYSMSFGDIGTIEGAKETAPAETSPAAEMPAEAEDAKQTPPAEEPAAETPPEEAKPEEAKPEEAKPEGEESAAPPSSGASRRNLPAAALAASDPALVLLALGQQEESPASESQPGDEKSEPPAEASAPSEPAPSEGESSEPMPSDAPAETPTDASAETNEPAEQPAEPTEKQAATTDADKSGAAPQASADVESAEGQPVASMVGATTVELTFGEAIAHAPLSEMIDAEIDRHEWRGAAFQLLNPSYQSGSEARYDKWTLETTLNQEQTRELLEAIKKQLAETPVFPTSSEIGGKVAGDTQLMAMYAMLASMVMIVLYVWIRFQNVIFGLAAVVALVHDVLVTVAFLAISAFVSPYMEALLVDPFKISLPVVAALLTIVGFSINDTIVVFDRIREVRGKSPELTPGMINTSVNQTLSRTLLTSGTVFIASIILYVVGGPGIHAFAYAMVVGVIAGTYSSVYIAAPVLLWLRKSAQLGRPSNAPVSTAAAGGN